MPRIDPLQLLKCLSVLLTPEGGILSRDEVPRLVNLMTKFSKKLVSKCVYVLILKSTETELVDMFMAEGGWTLIQTWLQDAVQTGNWDLVREILSLLLVTPVDVERLKLNILPKLIKSLSRREELDGVAQLSTQLVQQWLAIVKGSSNMAIPQAKPQVASEKADVAQAEIVNNTPDETVNAQVNIPENKREPSIEGAEGDNNSDAISTGSFYKPSVKDGKVGIRKLVSEEGAAEEVATSESSEEIVGDSEKSNNYAKNEVRDKSKSKSSKHSTRSSSHSKDREKDRDKDKSKSSKSSSSSSKSKSSSSSRRDKDRKDRDKDKEKHRGSSSSSKSSSSKDRRDSKDKDKDKDKEKQAEKDKDTLDKIKPKTIEKLGRIPKKSSSSTEEIKSKDNREKESKEKENELKKKSFSVGIRKDSDERPKTVKRFNAKMRSTGLEEEVKPAPPRPVKKPTPSVQLPTIPIKRPSPPREHKDPTTPPEKKLKIDKIDVPERPGSIKLIPPKPKPLLQESDLFMDALTASATAKKEPKKRKRRPSISKDSSSPSSSPAREQPQTPTSPTRNPANSSPLGLKNIAPINFYQDTLSTEENNSESENNSENKESADSAAETTENNISEISEDNKETPASPATPTDENNEEDTVEPKKSRLEGGLKGVLLYTKKKGPKRTISWKVDADLVEIRYFELDETERVNVTKTFGDMAKMEMSSEREALQLSRKTVGEDLMESQIMWRFPYIIDQVDGLAVPGNKSLEKDIQFAREKSVLQALYFDKRRIPDSPDEPVPENHQMSDPVLIPLEDPDSQEIDLRSTPWPEPKGAPPHVEPPVPPHMFPTIPGPFNPPFNNMPPPAFQGLPPRFAGPGGPVTPGPGNFIPPNIMPNGNMLGPPNMGPPTDLGPMNPNMNPNMFPPGPGHDAFGPGPDFPMFVNQPNNMNMFPPNPPNNFNNHRSGNRGGFRRGRGDGNWVRMNGPGNWKRGGGHRGGRLCKNVQNHGYCRNRDNCPFVHP